jgi:hypothetical protein
MQLNDAHRVGVQKILVSVAAEVAKYVDTIDATTIDTIRDSTRLARDKRRLRLRLRVEATLKLGYVGA